jgi:hypothetical protein
MKSKFQHYPVEGKDNRLQEESSRRRRLED